MSRTPLWRKALPEPPAGKANVRVYLKRGLGDEVFEEVINLNEVSLEVAEAIVKVTRNELNSRPVSVVHILRGGISFCRLPGPPANWPLGHLWVGYTERKEATCAECLSVAREVVNRIDKVT